MTNVTVFDRSGEVIFSDYNVYKTRVRQGVLYLWLEYVEPNTRLVERVKYGFPIDGISYWFEDQS